MLEAFRNSGLGRALGWDTSRLEAKFDNSGFTLEHIKLFTHQGPVETTLKKIDDSGLLSALTQLQETCPQAIAEIVISPILPMTGRWEITGNPYDRLFVVIQPERYSQIVDDLEQRGFAVDEEHPSLGFEPYFFEAHGNKFARGTHNADAFIIQTDFPRPEVVTE